MTSDERVAVGAVLGQGLGKFDCSSRIFHITDTFQAPRAETFSLGARLLNISRSQSQV